MRTPILCFLLLLFGTCVCAQEGLSLSDAIQRGLANNYQIRLAQADLKVAQNNDDYALTGKAPVISLGLSPGISYRNNTNPASFALKSSTFSYSIAPNANLNWTIFNGGRVEIAKEQLTTLANLSAGQLQVQVENSLADIIQAYYNAVVAQEQVGVLQRVLDLSRDRIDYQKVRSEFGQAGRFDQLQANDAYLNDSTSLIIQQTTYKNALRNLLQLMGEEELNQDYTLTTELGEVTETYDREALEAQLLASNSQLKTLQINQRLAAINTRLIDTEYKPQVALNLGASYDITVQTGTQTLNSFDENQPSRELSLPGIAARTLSSNLGVSATYLLFDGRARDVRKQAAKLEEITSSLNYEAVSQQLRSALQNTLALYDNQVEIVQLTRGLIDNAEQNLDVAEERFKGGAINSFDYRAIQIAYVNAEFQLLNSLLNLKNTETELLRLTGQIVD
ncbi:MAG: TolC family protein [Bacteroidota bacterium]